MTRDGATRRDVLKGIAAGTATLSATGVVSAGDAGRYVVTALGGGTDRRLERAGFTVHRSLAGGDVLVVSGTDDPGDVRGVAAATRDVRLRLERPSVTEAPDETATDEEPLYGLQWDKQVTNVADAHDVTTGDGATVAIIDTGTDLDHPDLAANAVPGALFRRVAGRGDAVVDGLGDGLFAGQTDVRVPADPALEPHAVTDADGNAVGYDPAGFAVEERDASDDVDGHGSHVSGITAASVNGFGTAGTAPDATVVPHRVFYWERQEVTYEPTEGTEVTEELVVSTTTTADILAAIDFAANAVGVDAMNLSIGTPPLDPRANSEGFRQAYRLVIQDAVNAGSVVVVSAGNSDTELNKGGVFTVPNSVPGAMSIAATGPNDERSFYSNYGANEIDVAAPGGGYETQAKTLATDTAWPFPTNLVLSTTPLDVFGAAYAYFAGTSMAAPQVAGAAALVASVSDANPHRIESVLERSAETATGTDRRDLGAGRLDVGAAIQDAGGG